MKDHIEIQGQRYLLVEIGGGDAVHLAPADDGDKDTGELQTLCGRLGTSGVDQGGVPNCRRCLASIDRLFPVPAADARIGLITALVVDALVARGYAEVVDVPGDQMPALRRAVRSAIRKRRGYKTNTFVRGGRLFVSSAEAYAPHAERHMTEAAAAMNAIFSDEDVPPIDDSGWRFHWTTWSVA